jgi:hypothetical protein
MYVLTNHTVEVVPLLPTHTSHRHTHPSLDKNTYPVHDTTKRFFISKGTHFVSRSSDSEKVGPPLPPSKRPLSLPLAYRYCIQKLGSIFPPPDTLFLFLSPSSPSPSPSFLTCHGLRCYSSRSAFPIIRRTKQRLATPHHTSSICPSSAKNFKFPSKRNPPSLSLLERIQTFGF